MCFRLKLSHQSAKKDVHIQDLSDTSDSPKEHSLPVFIYLACSLILLECDPCQPYQAACFEWIHHFTFKISYLKHLKPWIRLSIMVYPFTTQTLLMTSGLFECQNRSTYRAKELATCIQSLHLTSNKPDRNLHWYVPFLIMLYRMPWKLKSCSAASREQGVCLSALRKNTAVNAR